MILHEFIGRELLVLCLYFQRSSPPHLHPLSCSRLLHTCGEPAWRYHQRFAIDVCACIHDFLDNRSPAEGLQLPELHALENCAWVVRWVGVEPRRDRETEEAHWLANRLPDARPDERRAVRPWTDGEVDENMSEQEQTRLRGEESSVHVWSSTHCTTRRHLWTLLHGNVL